MTHPTPNPAPSTSTFFQAASTGIGSRASRHGLAFGVMAIGEYKFGTTQKEVMTVVSGTLTVKLPGSDDWADYNNGDSFTVAANESFQLKVAVETAYLCTYE